MKKLTIEILMAVTDSEVRSVAEEVMKEVKMPRSSRWDMTQEPTQRNRTEQSRAQQREKDREGPNKILGKHAQHMCTHTHMHGWMDTHTQTNGHTHTQTDEHTHIHTHRLTDPHTPWYSVALRALLMLSQSNITMVPRPSPHPCASSWCV